MPHLGSTWLGDEIAWLGSAREISARTHITNNLHNYARVISISGQCIRDTFNVRPSYGIKVPTICGINTGQHSKNTY